jgi:signal recognition particle GTPase
MVRGMPLPPELSADQRQAALEKAAVARRMRAELKEKLKMGSVTLSELLQQADADEVVGKMKVLAVLESMPGLGKVKARRLMDEIGISETRRLHGLGEQQRKRLLEKLHP